MTDIECSEYIKNGGEVFNIEYIDTISECGSKMIMCSNREVYYINNELTEVHGIYPFDGDSEVTDKLFKEFLLTSISVYVKKLHIEYENNEKLLRELKVRML